jgi:hypothetical protein
LDFFLNEKSVDTDDTIVYSTDMRVQKPLSKDDVVHARIDKPTKKLLMQMACSENRTIGGMVTELIRRGVGLSEERK